MIKRIIGPTLVGVCLISMLINGLMLTGPLFMLQVYDRVLASGSVPTLVVIGSMAFMLYIFLDYSKDCEGEFYLEWDSGPVSINPLISILIRQTPTNVGPIIRFIILDTVDLQIKMPRLHLLSLLSF